MSPNLKEGIFEFTNLLFRPADKRIFFDYKLKIGKKEICYRETIILPKAVDISKIPKDILTRLLSGLHIILGISYYKLYYATKIAIKNPLIKLHQKEAEFFNIVYKKGLGEFFYKNQLDPNNFPGFPFDNKKLNKSCFLPFYDKYLVEVGGGKDSIVAFELLKKKSLKITPFYLETQENAELIKNVIKKMEFSSLKIKRILDPKIFEKNQYQPYTGHVPISAIYAFLGLLTAVFYNYSFIVTANEYSSNFGNIKYKNEVINHQWSKSSEFELLFREYIKEFISPNIFYFSLLRPFYEIRIAKIFSNYKNYFPYFSSCNQNFKIRKENKKSLWCHKCPKCLFIFTLLSAFLSKKELLKIFKKNLFQERELLPLMRDLLGFGKMKPFDCVGTFEETKAALFLSRKKFKNDLIVKTFLSKIKNSSELIKKVFKSNFGTFTPPHLRFLGMENALILGYGKEGETTKKYLKKNYPFLKIGIADRKFQKNYLEKQEDYDIAIKTPGINKELVKIPYTTATNIFFSHIKHKNKIIGITGSKGKSTTTTLIYQILKNAGKKVRLAGNIGNPMLGELEKPIKKDEIFVLELSSYQLDDIEFSPDIAVVVSLFPEHMDYHKSIKNYYEAKKNITNFQNEQDFFVYNPKYKEFKKWAKTTKARAIPFVSKIPLKDDEILLKGPHNKENIKGAITVARLLGVSWDIIKKTIKEFRGLPHRLEFIGEYNGIKFYDDAISTTPDSTIMAIKTLKKIGTIFLGGEDRGYNFTQLERVIRKYKIKNIVLFPDSGKRILKSKKGFNIIYTRSMNEAVRFAYQYTPPGFICLLSCASPSYSLWKNYEEKGKLFQYFVKKLASSKNYKK